jgi:hypothetical protein
LLGDFERTAKDLLVYFSLCWKYFLAENQVIRKTTKVVTKIVITTALCIYSMESFWLIRNLKNRYKE